MNWRQALPRGARDTHHPRTQGAATATGRTCGSINCNASLTSSTCRSMSATFGPAPASGTGWSIVCSRSSRSTGADAPCGPTRPSSTHWQHDQPRWSRRARPTRSSAQSAGHQILAWRPRSCSGQATQPMMVARFRGPCAEWELFPMRLPRIARNVQARLIPPPSRSLCLFVGQTLCDARHFWRFLFH